MGNNTITFQIRDIDANSWYNLTNNIERKILNKQTKDWENRNLDDYFKQLIIKLSKLTKEQVNKIVELDTKIKVEEK